MRRPTQKAAVYEIIRQSPTELVIRDIGRTQISVTNDAEGVVRELHESGALKSQKLLYYDSEGRLDEILHDQKGTFLGFGPGPLNSP